MEEILDILKYILPSVITFITAFVLVKKFLDRELQDARLKAKLETSKTITPLKLQAYERLALLCERISLTALVTRLHKQGMSARLLQSEMTKTIRAEYEHNITQQIYVSSKTWDSVKAAKEESIKAVNIAAARLSDSASGMDLVNSLYEIITKLDRMPTDVALEIIKHEVRTMF